MAMDSSLKRGFGDYRTIFGRWQVCARPRAFAARLSSYGDGKVGIPCLALRHLGRACYTLGLVVEWKF
jgi:hypothetical protein